MNCLIYLLFNEKFRLGFHIFWGLISHAKDLLWIKNLNRKHSWAKFKIVRKPGRKFYYFMTNFQGSGFSFQSLTQNIKVVVFPSNCWFQKFKVVFFPLNFWIQKFKAVFPSNFWNTTIIWQILKVILNFFQECYYLKNKERVVDFAKGQGLVKF